MFEILTAGVPLDLQKTDNGFVMPAEISEPCSLRFKNGNDAAHFDLRADFFRLGGELLVAFVKHPALLHKDVSLVQGETSRIEKFASYDDARGTVCAGWRKLSDADRKRVRLAVFYHFVPDVGFDPVAATGYYIETVPR